MTEFYLFRHGETDMNLGDELVGGRSNHISLNPTGERQADELGFWIYGQGLTPDLVIVSPAVRAQQTMNIALSRAGVIEYDPITEDGIQEITQGVMENKKRSEVYTPDVIAVISTQLKDFKFEEGESMNDVAGRVDKVIKRFVDIRHDDKKIFMFTHDYAIRCVVGHYLNWDHSTIRSTAMPNASATIIKFAQGGVKPKTIKYGIDTGKKLAS